MLSSLHIENIAVVKRADIDFINGFNVMTGETGAGKSVIIDSINLLKGQRIGKEIIRTGEERALIGALFTDLTQPVIDSLQELGISLDGEKEVMLQRSISLDGKNSAKINGRSVNVSLLREVASLLVTIHGQQDNQILSNENSAIILLDKYAELDDMLAEYREIYNKLTSVKNQIRALNKDEGERIRTIEMLSYQINEIEAAKLKVGEEESLEERKLKIKNLERISKQLSFAYRALKGNEKGNAAYIIERSISSLMQIEDVVPSVKSAYTALEEALSLVEDASEQVYSLQEDDSEDPTALLDKIESRLDLIEKLRKKYGRSIAEIIEYKNKAKERLLLLENSDDRKIELEKEKNELSLLASRLADALHEKRVEYSNQMSKGIKEHLEFLDMPKVSFNIRVERQLEDGEYSFSERGIDSVTFMVATNVGEPEMPIAKIASGGEMARIMLAIKCVTSDKDLISTLIFDEVDSGVSGKTARKVGIKLLNAAKTAQIICVTHSAQIASLSDCHLLIHKDEEDGRIYTKIEELDEEGRIGELARILGGINVTEKQRAAARELIEEKSAYLEA